MIVIAGLFVFGCNKSSDTPADPTGDTHTTGTHWDYTDPAGWGDLDHAYATCKDGVEQSPVDIRGFYTATGVEGVLTTSYLATPLVLTNNGHTLQVEYEAGSTITINGQSYELLQFHFHSPSEHKVDGAPYDMEAHFVHKDASGDLAVLGVFINADATADNAGLSSIFDNFPATEVSHQHVTGVEINGGDILPVDKSFFHYEGSLTTPPCTEAVSWNILKTPVSISAAQLAQFTTIVHGGNARPTQPIGARTVVNDGFTVETAGHSAAPHWDYTNPALWGDETAYATCSNGVEQSPIDIVTANTTTGTLGDISADYHDVPLVLTNNGHTLQVEYEAGSSITINGQSYDLLQFHFHNQSENTVDGTVYDMEAHFVHKNADGELAVLGLFINGDSTGDNANFTPIFDNFPTTEVSHQSVANLTVNGGDLLPVDKSYFHFDGSLTTPPCTEAVSWNVLKTPVSVSAAQLAQFTAIMSGNKRPVQPIGSRTVTNN